MKTQNILLRLLPLILFTQYLTAQSIGIKTIAPLATLDINGSVAIREGGPLSIANGTNNDVTIDTMSFYRITAPTAVFTVTGFSNGYDGRVLILINATSYAMTLKHQVTSSAANQINTGGSDAVLAANGVATLMYNATLTKWMLAGGQGFITTSTDWSLTGNSGTTAGTNFVGTTDAQDVVFKANSLEGMRLNTSGYVGINITAPAAKFHIAETATGSIRGILDDQYSSDATPPHLNLRKARGTVASPTTLSTNDGLGSIAFAGYTGASFVNAAYIEGYAAEGFTTSKTGSYLTFNTTLIGTTGTTERMRIADNGSVGMGTATPYANLQIHGDGKSGLTVSGTTAVPSPTGGSEVALSRGGFSKPAATVQLIDYGSYSGGLSFNVHKGTVNSGGGTFADNWPTDVFQAMTIVNNGQIGIVTSDPNTSLDVDGGLTILPSSTINLTADNQAVTVGNESFIILTSTSATATSRTFTLSSGLQSGQILIILLTSNAAELADSGNCNLASTYAMGVNDTISLIWNGSTWYETERSNN